MKENNRKKGARKEAQAAAWLEGKGLQILERNYRCKKGEIDLIARENGTYVFLEVKYRKGDGCGHPAEAVDEKKQKRISGSALWYLARRGALEAPCRFDVIAVDGEEGRICWYRNAFDYRF